MIGIIVAIDNEAALLKDRMILDRMETRAGRDFLIGKLGGKEIVVVQCRAGKVNAAMAAQILIDIYHVEAMINTGVAGALDPILRVGDVVVASAGIQHDYDTSEAGDPVCLVSGVDVVAIPLDEKVCHLASAINREINPEVQTIEGIVATGDQFVCTKEKKQEILQNTNAVCCEMEGAAMAQVAYLNNVPALVIRAISDQADEKAQISYSEFQVTAIQRSTKLVEELLRRL